MYQPRPAGQTPQIGSDRTASTTTIGQNKRHETVPEWGFR